MPCHAMILLMLLVGLNITLLGDLAVNTEWLEYNYRNDNCYNKYYLDNKDKKIKNKNNQENILSYTLSINVGLLIYYIYSSKIYIYVGNFTLAMLVVMLICIFALLCMYVCHLINYNKKDYD